ncbi:protein containing Transglutaminase-like domain protein, partial [human gut metagenome]
ADTSTILPQILNDLQQSEVDSAYLQMESAYRDFVDAYALAVPQEFTDEMGSLLEEVKQNFNFFGVLTKEEAQLCALAFLETCFDGNTSLPLDSTAKGTTYQYATVAALALRYYGIPARYVEGFTVKTQENFNISATAENAGAWVEVYQDGVGWLPLALTPGLESLAPE